MAVVEWLTLELLDKMIEMNNRYIISLFVFDVEFFLPLSCTTWTFINDNVRYLMSPESLLSSTTTCFLYISQSSDQTYKLTVLDEDLSNKRQLLQCGNMLIISYANAHHVIDTKCLYDKKIFLFHKNIIINFIPGPGGLGQGILLEYSCKYEGVILFILYLY